MQFGETERFLRKREWKRYFHTMELIVPYFTRRVRYNKGSNKHGLLPARYYNSPVTARWKLVTDETNGPATARWNEPGLET